MFAWTTVLTGPLLLPMAFWLRQDLPLMAAEAMLVAGVIGLFLAICAMESVGTDPKLAPEKA